MSVTTRRARILAAVGLTALLAPPALITAPAAGLSAAEPITLYANPGDRIAVDFSPLATPETQEWLVPAGVTSIEATVAAGSGGGSEAAPGGVGGELVATVPVTPGETLLIVAGRAGGISPLITGGEGSGIASADGRILIVAGGGGAFRCGAVGATDEDCGTAGAGGFAVATPNGVGGDGSGAEGVPAGTGATALAPGVSADGLVDGDIRTPAVPPSEARATVDGEHLVLAPPTAPPSDTAPLGGLYGGGGGGYFAGGHGGGAFSLNAFAAVSTMFGSGGAGGSGFLSDSAAFVGAGDNVGDGFVSISYVVPEPEVVDAPELGLTLDVTSVPAGGSFTLGGAGFDPERDYPVILNSEPVLLGTVTTDAEGAFRATLLVPVTVPPGDHVIAVGDASIPITVTAAAAVAEGDALAFADAPELAATGPDPLAASILGALAVALLASGAAAIRASRQPFPARRAATRVR